MLTYSSLVSQLTFFDFNLWFRLRRMLVILAHNLFALFQNFSQGKHKLVFWVLSIKTFVSLLPNSKRICFNIRRNLNMIENTLCFWKDFLMVDLIFISTRKHFQNKSILCMQCSCTLTTHFNSLNLVYMC